MEEKSNQSFLSFVELNCLGVTVVCVSSQLTSACISASHVWSPLWLCRLLGSSCV